MTDTPEPTKRASREMSGVEQGKHMNEVPMPEQKTGDVDGPPDDLPHLADGQTGEERPDHPQSDRA